MGVDGRLLDRNWIEHLSFIGAFAEQDLVLSEKALWFSVLQVRKCNPYRVSRVLQIIVRVLSLRQNSKNIDLLLLPDDSMHVVNARQTLIC